jgi:hypothetical protein
LPHSFLVAEHTDLVGIASRVVAFSKVRRRARPRLTPLSIVGGVALSERAASGSSTLKPTQRRLPHATPCRRPFREHADMAGIADMGRRFVSTTGVGLRGLAECLQCPGGAVASRDTMTLCGNPPTVPVMPMQVAPWRGICWRRAQSTGASASFSHSAAISLRTARDSRSAVAFASCRQWVA